MFLKINIFCHPSLEPSRRDGSNEGSQHMFWLGNKKNYLQIIPVTPHLELCSCLKFCCVSFVVGLFGSLRICF